MTMKMLKYSRSVFPCGDSVNSWGWSEVTHLSGVLLFESWRLLEEESEGVAELRSSPGPAILARVDDLPATRQDGQEQCWSSLKVQYARILCKKHEEITECEETTILTFWSGKHWFRTGPTSLCYWCKQQHFPPVRSSQSGPLDAQLIELTG